MADQPPRRRVATSPTPTGDPAPGVPAPRSAGTTPGPSAAAATARRPVSAAPPPSPAVQAHVERALGTGFAPQKFDVVAGFQPRNGDVLHVSYPEVVLPMKVQYASVRVGGMGLTRQLAEGDDVVAEAEAIYNFLAAFSAQAGEAKVIAWGTVLEQSGTR